MQMIAEFSQRRASDYIANLAATGRYSFRSSDARVALGVSADATRLTLNRLICKSELASPARGFYVIIPPEYQSLGCLPAEQFIPALMQSLGLSYYAGLLSAAQYHDAAHHRPQEFQVLLASARRPIHCGRVRVTFVVRKRIKDVAVKPVNTPRGTILVSSPEATAIDLVGYHRHAGGLDQVATVLSELAERIDPQELTMAAATAPVSWSQRLGYLLTLVGAGVKATELKNYVKSKAPDAVPLLPGLAHAKSKRDPDWKLFINVNVEPEL